MYDVGMSSRKPGFTNVTSSDIKPKYSSTRRVVDELLELVMGRSNYITRASAEASAECIRRPRSRPWAKRLLDRRPRRGKVCRGRPHTSPEGCCGRLPPCR